MAYRYTVASPEGGRGGAGASAAPLWRSPTASTSVHTLSPGVNMAVHTRASRAWSKDRSPMKGGYAVEAVDEGVWHRAPAHAARAAEYPAPQGRSVSPEHWGARYPSTEPAAPGALSLEERVRLGGQGFDTSRWEPAQESPPGGSYTPAVRPGWGGATTTSQARSSMSPRHSPSGVSGVGGSPQHSTRLAGAVADEIAVAERVTKSEGRGPSVPSVVYPPPSPLVAEYSVIAAGDEVGMMQRSDEHRSAWYRVYADRRLREQEQHRTNEMNRRIDMLRCERAVHPPSPPPPPAVVAEPTPRGPGMSPALTTPAVGGAATAAGASSPGLGGFPPPYMSVKDPRSSHAPKKEEHHFVVTAPYIPKTDEDRYMLGETVDDAQPPKRSHSGDSASTIAVSETKDDVDYHRRLLVYREQMAYARKHDPIHYRRYVEQALDAGLPREHYMYFRDQQRELEAHGGVAPEYAAALRRQERQRTAHEAALDAANINCPVQPCTARFLTEAEIGPHLRSAHPEYVEAREAEARAKKKKKKKGGADEGAEDSPKGKKKKKAGGGEDSPKKKSKKKQ